MRSALRLGLLPAGCSSAEALPEPGPRGESLMQPGHPEELVGRVEVLVPGRKREIDGVESEDFPKRFRYRQRPAHPHEDRAHAVRLRQRRLRSLENGMVTGNAGRPRAMAPSFDRQHRAWWRMAFKVGDDETRDLIGILIRHQPA